MPRGLPHLIEPALPATLASEGWAERVRARSLQGGTTEMSNDAESALLDRDNAHLLHPLHSRATPRYRQGLGWRGKGPSSSMRTGDRFIDGLSGLWNNNRRQRLPRADRGR